MATSTDVVVVGAGIVGCAVAFELACRGASVRLLDARSPGMGATQASAGMLAPYIEAGEEGPLLDLTARGLECFEPFLKRVTSESGTPVAYRRTGTLDVALDDEAMARMQRSAAVLARRGVPAQMLDAKAVKSAEPQVTGDAIGGLLIASQGFVGVSEMASSLVAGGQRRGVMTGEPERVRQIGRDGTGLVVHTERGSFAAGAVVVAAGSWSGQIEIDGAEPAPVRPIRGQLLYLRWEGPPLARVTWSGRCYLVPWVDRTLLVGATVEDVGFDERTTAAGVGGLIDAASELVPHAGSASFLAARVGLRPGTPDHLPIIGASAALPNLMYATGHYRNGVLLAPLTAALVADALLDRRTDPLLAFTRPDRFGRL